MRKNLTSLTRAAIIASLYIMLTLLSNIMGLASGAVQIRLSEALVLLPVLFPEGVWGLFVGCLISNILTGCVIWDIIFGSLATLAGAICTLKLKNHIYLACIAPVITNAVVVPMVIKYAYNLGNAWWILCLYVTIGEAICAFLLAPMIIKMLKKHKF